MYDVIIVGSGPAGMTAGIYAVRREMKTLILGKEPGGQLMWASDIENYPGFESIMSYDLINRMKNQVTNFGAEMRDVEVKKIEKLSDGNFKLYTNKEEYLAKTVIITIGLSPRRLAVPGETELNAKGVSYCANCDGPFYKGKDVAVIGGGNSALDAAEYLSKVANKVYLVHRSAEFRAFETLISKVKARKNVEILFNTSINKIAGKDKVEKIIVFNKETDEEREIKLEGVFVEIGRIASTDLVAEFVDRDERDQILTKADMSTKTPGLYAAGDVVTCEYKQITIAAGQATIAALSAYQYLQMKSS